MFFIAATRARPSRGKTNTPPASARAHRSFHQLRAQDTRNYTLFHVPVGNSTLEHLTCDPLETAHVKMFNNFRKRVRAVLCAKLLQLTNTATQDKQQDVHWSVMCSPVAHDTMVDNESSCMPLAKLGRSITFAQRQQEWCPRPEARGPYLRNGMFLMSVIQSHEKCFPFTFRMISLACFYSVSSKEDAHHTSSLVVETISSGHCIVLARAGRHLL